MDAFTAATWTGQRARATCVRDRSAPIVMPRQMAGHMPDPRFAAVPTCDHRERGWARKYAVAAFWLGIAIGLFIAGLVMLP